MVRLCLRESRQRQALSFPVYSFAIEMFARLVSQSATRQALAGVR